MTPGRRPLIAHVVYGFRVGGLENGIVNLINHMPVDRYRHVLISLTDGDAAFHGRIRSQEVALFQLHKQPGHGMKLYPAVFALLRRLRPDIVHTRNLAALEMAVPAWAAGVPVRLHGEHGWDTSDPAGQSRRHRLVRKAYSPFVSHYIALSAHLENYLTQRVGISRRRVTRICNGVDVGRFSRARSDGTFSGMPFNGANDWLVGTVGRLQAIKDQLNLVRGFASWVQRNQSAYERARLILVGDGPLRPEVEALRSQLGLEDHVWLAGERDDIPAVMAMLDCFVLPSRAEGISNTLLETMACGYPVVATRVGGNGELVVDGATGRLVPSEDPEALADAMNYYFSDPACAIAHGRAGRFRVEREFSLEAMVDMYLACYDELLAAAGRQPALAGRFHN